MSRKHALIIDDNARNVDVLARLLAAENITSTQVLDPGALLQTAETMTVPDIVFLDLEMPDYNGYQVLNWFKSDPRFQKVKVVAYTVHVSEINNAHQQGFDGFLGKPLRYDRFPDQLNRILNGEQVWETT
jgi:two-component system cell cycle response regulator DivK